MTDLVLPKLSQVGTNEWSDVEDNDVAIRTFLNSTGVHVYQAGTIANAAISASAAIAYSKLASMSTGAILLGNAGTPTATTMGGDATIGATGTLTIANDAINAAKIASNAVGASEIGSLPFVRVTKTAVQSIATASATAVTFDSETVDTDTMHDNSVNPSRLTMTTAGVYLVVGYVEFDDTVGDGTNAEASIRSGGATALTRQDQTTGAGGTTPNISVSALHKFSAADYVELVVSHTAGSSKNVATACSFAAHWLGEG